MKKKNKPQKVNKMIDANSLKTALADMQSLWEEIMTSFGGAVEDPAMAEIEMGEESANTEETQQAPDDTNITMAENGDDENNMEKDDHEDDVDKTIETTQGLGADATDSTEQRIDENQSTLTEENVNEVDKAVKLLKSLIGKVKNNKVVAPIQKSNDVNESVVQSIQILSKSIEKLFEGQTAQGDAIGNILSAYNITGEIEKSIKPETKIENNPDTKFAIELIKQLQANGSESVQKTAPTQINNANIVHKTLSDKKVLTGLIGR